MKKLIRAKVRFKGLSVGLDAHKEFIQFSVLDRDGDEIDRGRIRSNFEELRKLVDKLKEKGEVQFALEACGCFIWIFDELAKLNGRERVHVAHPSRLAAAKSREKNDANDAWWLAYYLREGTLPEALVVEGKLRELRIAARELRWWTDTRSDAMRRLRSHLAQAGLALPKGFLSSACKRQITREIIKQVRGMRGLAAKRLWKQLRHASRMVTEWRVRVSKLAATFPEAKLMADELPGFGTIIAGTTLGELGDPRRFQKAKAYARATGLTPGYRNSGGKRGVIGITREGSRHARWAITRAVISCMRCKGGAGHWVKTWVQERSKHRVKKKVIVAAARKLAEGVWRLFALGEVFDLRRAFPMKDQRDMKADPR